MVTIVFMRILVVLSLRRWFTGREMRPVPDRIAQLPDLSDAALAKEAPFEGGVFDDGLVEGHGILPGCNRCRIRPFGYRVGE